jgi:hypothetical protein
LGISIVALCALVLPNFADQFRIDWFSIDGGGTSTNGNFSVSGTVGQADASIPMTGGSFSMTGGFWSILSPVQTPGAPLLTITITATNSAVVSWPLAATGFALQVNSSLHSTNWISVSEPVTTNSASQFIIVNPPHGSRFYRLSKQP